VSLPEDSGTRLGAEKAQEEDVLVVRIPLKRRTRGGRRLMVVSDASTRTPDENISATATRRDPPDDPILKALGRAWRWKRLIDAGTSIVDLAADEKVHKSYLCRLLRLTLLSPTITEAILDSTLSTNVLLIDLINSSVVDWSEQDRRLPASPSC